MAGIFKAYDIRGVVENNLTPNTAYLIGRGLAHFIFKKHKPIVVSRDMRVHSPELSEELIRGLSAGGCGVLDIGLAATPMNYWANVHYKSGGSVMVTASHNGMEYNGFKVSGENAIPLDFSSDLNKVEALVEEALAGHIPDATANAGSVQQISDALENYLQFMLPFVEPGETKLKIAVDCGNGMGGFFLPDFVKQLPWLECVPLFWEMDGTFPNHEANPLEPENLHDVEKAVVQHQCDFGVAFDGDADRCMFVDNEGKSISSDLMTAFIATEVLKEAPGSSILYDLRSSHIVPETIESQCGVAVRGRVGHSFMKRLLKEKNAPFGGELSGHYYFKDCFNTDSGLRALIYVLNIWRKNQQDRKITMSEMIVPLRKYRATGEINFKVKDVPSVLQNIKEHFKLQNAEIDELDGLTVNMPEWWFNLRSSNTEPLLRLNLEAANEAARDEKLHDLHQFIEE
ncbi:MAG: phosphomannomutase/phosphoglucomutase [Abditibacteriaceae bacterium]